jgi:hypothetical protein
MNKKFEEQNAASLERQRTQEDKETPKFDLSHLGMNGNDEVYITEDVVKDLEQEIKSDYHKSFCPDGFFWGQQWQEAAVEEYKSQDLKFLNFCKRAIKDGRTVVYSCSW